MDEMITNDPLTGYVKAIAICVFRNGDRILVGDGFDPTKDEIFYRPPGGRIEFGEPSVVALRREMREELGTEISNPRLLGVMENLFTFDGERGHEIVFVYDAILDDRSLYECDQFKATESDGSQFNAIWLDLKSIGPETPPVYPDGLVDMLRNDQKYASRS
jgi:ADP-ribose pyrophosphatase YjhB (NUDIX family)